VIGNKKLSDL